MSSISVRAALLAVWACAALLVVFSNHLDWDAFYAFSEVERRAWLVDHELPLWSYQLCGGIERAGDPQSYGLAPLFVLVLVFGALWGIKLQVLLSLALGAYFTARILERFHAPAPGGARLPYAVLATLFVLGNYFMWHLLVGHVTFSNALLGLGIVHYTLKGYEEGLSGREFALGALVCWQHYSSGFFHSLVHLLGPFFLAFAIYVALDRAQAALRPAAGPGLARRLSGAVSFHVLGLGLGSYKLLAVWNYFRGIDRSLESRFELLSAAQLAAHIALPSWQLGWLLPGDLGAQWGIHEYSAFSWLVPLALVALGVAACTPRARAPAPGRDASLALLAVVYLLVTASFSLGEFSRIAPFALLNQLAPVRVSGRFHVGVVLAIAMGLMRLLRRPPCARLVGRAGCGVLLAGQALTLASFLPLASATRLAELRAAPARQVPQMREWVAIDMYPSELRFPGREFSRAHTSQMYEFARSGRAVTNCYNALPRSQAPKVILTPWSIPLIDTRIGRPSQECVDASYFTQNRLVLDASCPRLTCTSVARVNPRQPEPALFLSTRHDRYCWRHERVR